MKPDRVLITRQDRFGKIEMTVFGEKIGSVLFRGEFDPYGRVSEAIHTMAWMAVLGESGLKLLPVYPPGTGYFIARKS